MNLLLENSNNLCYSKRIYNGIFGLSIVTSVVTIVFFDF